MPDPRDTSKPRPRPWDVRELAAANVLRLPLRRTTRVVRQIPTAKEQTDTLWRSCDRWTRELLRELGRLGYDVTGGVGERTYLTNVGRAGATVVLRVDPTVTDGIKVVRVAVGRLDLTARQATRELRKRAAR